MSMQAAKLYAIEQGASLSKITITEFFSQIHSQFYSDRDISFMKYFLELTEHDEEFYVEHTKLKEYGIMTSTQSSHVLEKLRKLGLLIDVDYLLRDVSQQHESGTKLSKVYYLTPDGFKKCLMRAQRRKDQAVDPVIYCDYYLLLEKIYKLYRDYESAYEQKLVSIKDVKIDSLERKIDQQSAELKQQSAELRQLMIYTKDSNEQIRDLHVKVDDLKDQLHIMFDFSTKLARMTLPMWNGSSVFKAQMDHMLKTETLGYALKHLKIMYVVGFYHIGISSDRSKSMLVVYFCCTNFADVGKRIKQLHSRHQKLIMMKPQVISLISHEINHERAKLLQLKLFPTDTNPRYVDDAPKKAKPDSDYYGERKAFLATLDTLDPIEIIDIFNGIIARTRLENFQNYQMRRDNVDHEISPTIIQHLVNRDSEFFSSTLPYCQEYINYYVYERDGRYQYQVPSRSSPKRSEFNNTNATATMYELLKLNTILEREGTISEVDRMIDEGIINYENSKSLLRVGRHVANVEQIDLPAETLERAEELDTDSD